MIFYRGRNIRPLCFRLGSLTFFWLIFINFCQAVETVELKVNNQVPQIEIDGVPVAPRIFYGATTGKLLRTDEKLRSFSFEFSPKENSGEIGTIHFRFERKPTIIWLDDFSIVELNSRRSTAVTGPYNFNSSAPVTINWGLAPPSTKEHCKLERAPNGGNNDSGSLKITALEPKGGAPSWPDIHLYHAANIKLDKEKKYRLSFKLRTEPSASLELSLYKPGNPYRLLASFGKDSFESQMKMARSIGMKMVTTPLPISWPKKGEKADWSAMDNICDQVLATDPELLLIPRLNLDPAYEWIDRHTTEEQFWEGCPEKIFNAHERRSVSIFDDEYRREAIENMVAAIKHLEEKYGKRIVGYHPCAQHTNEWFYQNAFSGGYMTVTPSGRKAWRRWLLNKYGDETNARRAICREDPDVVLDDFPSLKLRERGRKSLFLDTALHPEYQLLLDFNEFLQEGMTNFILEVASNVRKVTERKKLTFFFYGYLLELSSMEYGPAHTGHYDLERLLKSADIDVLCAPVGYRGREPGGCMSFMSPGESIVNAGKLFLVEDDTRTHLAIKEGVATIKTWKEMAYVHQRNLGNYQIRNYASWWMDLPPRGWLDDPAIWENFEKMNGLEEENLFHPTPYQPEVATFLSEKSLLSVQNNTLSMPLVYWSRFFIGITGMTYGQYRLDDFLKGKTKAKLNIFTCDWYLSQTDRARLRRRTRDTVSIWGFGSGYLDERGGSVEHISELTRFKVKKVKCQKIRVTPNGAHWGLKDPIVFDSIEYCFSASDARPAETLAVFEDGSPAIAIRKTEGKGVSFFVGIPYFSLDLLRYAGEIANVHSYTHKDCAVAANRRVVVVHGVRDGEILLTLESPATVYDVIQNRTTQSNGLIPLSLKKGETKVLQLNSKKER